MTPASSDALVCLDEGVFVSPDLYSALSEINGEDLRLQAEGKPRLPMREKARRANISFDTAQYLFSKFDAHNRRLKDLQKHRDARSSHDFEDVIARAPKEKTQLANRRVPSDHGSRIDWEAVKGYVDEQAIIREQVAEMIAAGTV
jgi:hypothetical protein